MERVARLVTVLPRPGLPRVPSRALVALAVFVGVLAASWFVLRDSEVFAVRSVEVIGLASSERAQVRTALVDEALDMSTLHVREDKLREAVEPFASVAGVRVQADFPHGLTIEVVEREPVGAVTVGGAVIPVTAGGRLLRGVRPSRTLPLLTSKRLAPGSRISDPQALSAVSVLAAAPPILRRRVARARTERDRGLVLDLRNGPDLFFGTSKLAPAKWQAAARVLAEPSSAGAVYLDLRIPGRVSAGGLDAAPEPTSTLPLTDPQGQPVNPQP